MRLDLEDFRQHYAGLSDEALLELDRSELVEEAQQCYDEELTRRQLHTPSETEDSPEDEIAAMLPTVHPDRKRAASTFDAGEKPDWLETAACACAFSTRPGDDGATELESARDVLEAAGIPCYVAVRESEPVGANSPPVHEYELLVPGQFSLLAQSILEKEIFNPRLEAVWKTHFELLSDEDLHSMNPQALTEGLLDRIERLTRIYKEEVSRRKNAGS